MANNDDNKYNSNNYNFSNNTCDSSKTNNTTNIDSDKTSDTINDGNVTTRRKKLNNKTILVITKIIIMKTIVTVKTVLIIKIMSPRHRHRITLERRGSCLEITC